MKELSETRKKEEDRDKDLSERVTNLEHHIRLMDEFEEYLPEDLVDKVAATEVDPKLVLLLDRFPKFCSAFQKEVKAKPKDNLENDYKGKCNH